MQKSTTVELKVSNTKLVFQYIYQKHRTTKLDIATDLNLSRPSVNQYIKELEERRLIEKNGFFDSPVGRKAEAITFSAMAKISIGVSILRDDFSITAINLYGVELKNSHISMPFQNTDLYYDQVCREILQFIDSLHVSRNRILGVGITLPGLISSDGTKVTYGKILGCTGLTTDVFSAKLGYPCSMIHDAEAAATVELWDDPELTNAVFIHIWGKMSGALIVGGQFLKGTALKSGVFEHMTIIPDGRPCYCGKQGCMETYCSLDALLLPGETIEQFFDLLRTGNQAAAERWKTYLNYLSIAINNLHMFVDYDIIIGGTLALYFNKSDLDLLHQMIEERTAFPSEKSFIRLARSLPTPLAKGASLPFIKEYLNHVI